MLSKLHQRSNTTHMVEFLGWMDEYCGMVDAGYYGGLFRL